MEEKKSYKSKTVGFNIGSGILLLLNSYFPVIELSSEDVGGILILVNLILRFFTKSPVKLY